MVENREGQNKHVAENRTISGNWTTHRFDKLSHFELAQPNDLEGYLGDVIFCLILYLAAYTTFIVHYFHQSPQKGEFEAA